MFTTRLHQLLRSRMVELYVHCPILLHGLVHSDRFTFYGVRARESRLSHVPMVRRVKASWKVQHLHEIKLSSALTSSARRDLLPDWELLYVPAGVAIISDRIVWTTASRSQTGAVFFFISPPRLPSTLSSVYRGIVSRSKAARAWSWTHLRIDPKLRMRV
jgi:hypothetical protein